MVWFEAILGWAFDINKFTFFCFLLKIVVCILYFNYGLLSENSEINMDVWMENRENLKKEMTLETI